MNLRAPVVLFRCILLLVTLGPSLLLRAAESVTAPVGRWERFELVVNNARTYADPYRDVLLEVIYTGPDGRAINFWGFHDGGQTWKLRFMPDQLGTWRYAAKFSDGSQAPQGTFQCVTSAVPGMISVHAENPTWFGFQGGGAVTLRGFHIGDRFFARNWDDVNSPTDGNPRARFLDWAQRQGYNTLTIASHYLNRATKGRGQGWDTPALWPLNAAEYQRMEGMLDELARRNFIVYPFATMNSHVATSSCIHLPGSSAATPASRASRVSRNATSATRWRGSAPTGMCSSTSAARSRG